MMLGSTNPGKAFLITHRLMPGREGVQSYLWSYENKNCAR